MLEEANRFICLGAAQVLQTFV